MPFTDHPNHAAVRAFTDALTDRVRAAQEAFFASFGRCFQRLRIPAAGNLDGTTLHSPDVALRPSDQTATWRDLDAAFFTTALKGPVHIRIDVYESPRGWGWILTFEFWKKGLDPAGDHWVFPHHEGPEKRSGVFGEWFLEPETEV